MNQAASTATSETPEMFPGYYTVHILKNGKVAGMLSVNGYSAQVWFHTWHGALIQMKACTPRARGIEKRDEENPMRTPPPTRPYGFTTTIAAPYAQAITRTRAALTEQGFGVLTEIDVKKTLKEKLDTEFRPYVILGACNPALAHRALEADLGVGLLLPCTVVVFDNGDGTSTVAAIDPMAALGSVEDNPALATVAHEAQGRLSAAVERLMGA